MAESPAPGGFSQDLERLEQIVRRLEAEELDLDEALRLFEEGVQRLRAARERLGAAELRVRQVIADQAGKLRLEDVDR
jgi:exodeoxyribonuclease VII small subunit